MSEDRIKALEAKVAELEKFVAGLKAALGGGSAGVGGVAPDSDLDGQYGDPIVRKDPKRWPGESYEGRSYSHCPAEYLDELASFLDWKAGKEDEDPAKKKYARYSRADAARARGWAARRRAGWKPKLTANGYGGAVDDPYGHGSGRGDAFEEDEGF